MILNWSAKTQLYGAPAAVLAGMAERVVWWQQAIPDATGSTASATLLPARRDRLLLAGCGARAGAPVPAPSHVRRRRRLAAPPPASAAAAARAARRRADRRPRRPPAAVEGTGPSCCAPRRCCARADTRMHTVIVGGDSYGLSPEYAASLSRWSRALGLSDARDDDRRGPGRAAPTSSAWTCSSTRRTRSRSGS